MKALLSKKLAVYFFSGLLVCFLAIMGFVYSQLNDVDNIKVMVVDKIEELIGGNISIDTAELKFEKGISVRLRNLSIDSTSGESHQIFVKNVWCVIRLWPLWGKKIEIKKLILEGASIELVRDKQGQFNYGNLLRWSTEATGSRFFKLLGASFMHRLSLSDGEVRFLDYYGISGPDPFFIAVKNINLGVDRRFFKNIFSFNLSGEIPSAHQPTVFQLSGSFDNLREGKGGWQNPIQGKIKIDQLYLAKFWPYLKNVLPAAFHDIWISLGSDFSGNLRDNLRSEGRLQYLTAAMEQKPVLVGTDSSTSGSVDYSFVLDKDSIKVQDFRLRSGPINFSGIGKLVGLKSQDPNVFFTIQTGEFKIEKTRQYLPLMFFPEFFHKEIDRRFDNGVLEIKSLEFDGSLTQLQKLNSKENKNLLAAEIVFKKVDWRSPLPPLEKVTGSLKYKNGNGFIDIVKARFEDLPIANIKGTVRNMMNNPLADLSVENKFELGKLNCALKKSIAGQSFKKILNDYQEVEGNGLLKAKLQGPLEDPEKISITAVLSMKGASFFDAYLQSRVRNFNGEIHFHHVPMGNQKQAKSSVPIVEGKNLSGEFGKSEFYNMQGKILRQRKNIVQEMKAVYRLNAAELPKIIEDIDFSGPEFALLKQAGFEKGDVEVHYRSLMDLDQPKKKKSWGEIKLKNISIKHPSDFQPLVDLVGEISFGDGYIGLNKIEGWYGNSTISLYGQLTPQLNSLVDFDLRITLADWTQADFKNVPYLQNLKFAGSINPEINLLGNRHSFKIKNKLDLTQASYKFQEAFYKKKNIPNKVEIEGAYSAKEGITVDQFKFILDNNSVTGEAKIKSFADPEYLIKIDGVGLRANAIASSIDVFKHSTDGKIDFNISGQGNLNQLDDSIFKGSAVLKDLVFEWEDRKNPLILSADVRFSGDTYNFRSGRMESGRSQISFRGRYKNEEQPELILKLTGKTLVVDQLISNKKDEDKVETNLKDLFEQSHLLSSGTSKISVDLGQLDYKWLTLGDVSGNFLLKDREIIFNRFRVGSKNPIKGKGKLSVKDPESIRFATMLQANEIEAEDFLAMFGSHFRGGLTGKFKKLKLSVKSRGRKLSENIRTLNGKLSFNLANGIIDTKKLKAGAFDLFDLEIPAENKNKTETDEGPLDYVGISGNFIHIGGIAETDNFIYETDQRKSAIVGKFDLNQLEMDTVVGVAHMPGLDKLLTQIPLVGKILTAGDEGSLIKTYYTVVGPFDNPKRTAIPFTSVGKKFMGLFQGVLQTSEEILNLPAKVGVGKTTN